MLQQQKEQKTKPKQPTKNKQTKTTHMIWNKTEACVSLYLLLLQLTIYKNQFLFICKKKTNQKLHGSARYYETQKMSRRPTPGLRHWWLFAAKTAARISSFPSRLVPNMHDATLQAQKCGVLKYILYWLSRCNLVAQENIAKEYGQFGQI